jgi:hypothetical protein
LCQKKKRINGKLLFLSSDLFSGDRMASRQVFIKESGKKALHKAIYNKSRRVAPTALFVY